MDVRRLLIGLVAIICVTLGLILTFANEGENNSFSGILVRVGMMLAATWLAFPVLKKPDGQNSLWMIGVALLLVVVVAARPRLFVLMIVVLGLVAAGNWLLRKISTSL